MIKTGNDVTIGAVVSERSVVSDRPVVSEEPVVSDRTIVSANPVVSEGSVVSYEARMLGNNQSRIRTTRKILKITELVKKGRLKVGNEG